MPLSRVMALPDFREVAIWSVIAAVKIGDSFIAIFQMGFSTSSDQGPATMETAKVTQ